MTNHFHMIVKTPRANLQEFMRQFSISYTAYFNRRHKRSGHLYQGRYKSFLIDVDPYLLQVSRYVHLNPVRTSSSHEDKKAFLDTYRWSSYPDYVSSSRFPFLSTKEILSYFSGRTSYKSFVEEGISHSTNPLEKGKGHGIIGDAPFIKEVLKTVRITPAREQPEARRINGIAPAEVLQAIGKRFHVDPEDILAKPSPRGTWQWNCSTASRT